MILTLKVEKTYMKYTLSLELFGALSLSEYRTTKEMKEVENCYTSYTCSLYYAMISKQSQQRGSEFKWESTKSMISASKCSIGRFCFYKLGNVSFMSNLMLTCVSTG